MYKDDINNNNNMKKFFLEKSKNILYSLEQTILIYDIFSD